MGGVVSTFIKPGGAPAPGQTPEAPGTATKVHFAEPVAQDATPATGRRSPRASAIKRSIGTVSGGVTKKTAPRASRLSPAALASISPAASTPVSAAAKGKPGPKSASKPGRKPGSRTASQQGAKPGRKPGRGRKPETSAPTAAATTAAATVAAAAAASPAAKPTPRKPKASSGSAKKRTLQAQRPTKEKRPVGRPRKAAMQ